MGYTIRVFVPDGDPDGIKIIDRMNWTGTGVVFNRNDWPHAKRRKEFDRTGVYILVGYLERDKELPRIYIGEGDPIRDRIESHIGKKMFWTWGIAFTSSSGGLNKAHVQWLEAALCEAADQVKLCHLDNRNVPLRPDLSEHEKADVDGFYRELLKILPIAKLQFFEKPRPVAIPATETNQTYVEKSAGIPVSAVKDSIDTIIVPARKAGFERVFLGECSWYAIRISGAMLGKIRYIASYQSKPISAITHIAPVKLIERYGENGKYKLIFTSPATEIKNIPLSDAKSGSMQSVRYARKEDILRAQKISDIWISRHKVTDQI